MLRPLVIVLTAALLSGCNSFSYYRRCGCRIGSPRDVCSQTPVADEERRALAVANETPLYVEEIPHQPPRVTPPDPSHAPFDSAAAMGAIHGIDLSSCKVHGARRSYGHAHITFERTGHPSTVLIDSPAGLSEDSVACIGDALGRASAPPFDGAPITVGATYLVQ
ncbi:MAG TPA: hypothetical protein VGI39_43325 [Polyangiaceae bacterium]